MKRRRSGPAVLLGLVAALAGTAARPPVGAGETPQATPAPAAPASKEIVVPEAEKHRANPVPNVPEAVASGRDLFSSQCAMCHGVTAEGRGDLARRLGLRVPDLTDRERQKRRTDGEWLYIIDHGHGDMPAEMRLAERQKWEMILYLRTVARPAAAR